MAEPGTGWGGVYQGFVAWLIGLDRVNSSGVADIMTDHDGRVHAFEIEYGNPRMKPCCNVVNVSTGDLTFFRLSGACERHCYAFCIGKADDKRINQLAGARMVVIDNKVRADDSRTDVSTTGEASVSSVGSGSMASSSATGVHYLSKSSKSSVKPAATMLSTDALDRLMAYAFEGEGMENNIARYNN